MSEKFNTFYTFIPRDLNKLPSNDNKNWAKFQVDNKGTPAGSKFNVNLYMETSNFGGTTLTKKTHNVIGEVGTFIHKFPLEDYETVKSYYFNIQDFDGPSVEGYFVNVTSLVEATANVPTKVEVHNFSVSNGIIKGFTLNVYDVYYSNGHDTTVTHPSGNGTILSLSAGSGDQTVKSGTFAGKEGFFVSQLYIQIIDKDV